MLIEFKDNSFTDSEKLQVLLQYHNVIEKVKVDDQDIPMVVLALNQDDVAKVEVDIEGALLIEYYGDDWQNNA